jgi:hypothetical protein
MKIRKYQTSVTRGDYDAEVEVNIEVEYTYDPGEKELRFGDAAHPGWGPCVEIEGVTELATGEDLTLTNSEAERIEVEILDRMGEEP